MAKVVADSEEENREEVGKKGSARLRNMQCGNDQ